MSKLQTLALDAVARVLTSLPADDVAVAVLAVEELAMLSVLPFALRTSDSSNEDEDDVVVKRARDVYLAESALPVVVVVAVHDGQSRRYRGRPAVVPTFVALGKAAVEKLGAALSEGNEEEDRRRLASRVLESGAWLSAIAAMGVHLVEDSGSELWFVKAVLPAMKHGLPSSSAAPLDAAWMAIARVLERTLNNTVSESQRVVLDGVLECSIASSCTTRILPATYCDSVLDILERQAKQTILSSSSASSSLGLDLAVASVGWLERLSSIGCEKDVALAVASSAARRLVCCTRCIVDSHVADRALLGHRCPLPLQRTRLLRRVLQGLAQLQCRPGILDTTTAGGGGCGLGTAVAHIVSVFESLVGLVSDSTAGDSETTQAL
ncbi:hypothetical protein IWW38_005009, partial [Coemansia aciculifera]